MIPGHSRLFWERGFTVADDVFSAAEVEGMTTAIESAVGASENFRKSGGLYAIRQFFKEAPGVAPMVLNSALMPLVASMFGTDYFVVKSIYFDKPPGSNWFVSRHQDLTISVKEKGDLDGFGPWTVKGNQYSVQPPTAILKNNFTIRVHLDDTNEHNGALRVIPGSHLDLHKAGDAIFDSGEEVVCNVPKGGVMLMRPLLVHASSRSTDGSQRRVIHIEFSNQALPAPLMWAEYLNCDQYFQTP